MTQPEAQCGDGREGLVEGLDASADEGIGDHVRAGRLRGPVC